MMSKFFACLGFMNVAMFGAVWMAGAREGMLWVPELATCGACGMVSFILAAHAAGVERMETERHI